MPEFVFADRGDHLELIGDFDGLYRADEDPWQQGSAAGEMADYYAHSRRVLIDVLRRNRANWAGLEVGCGLGYLSHQLHEELELPIVGLDVSREAVAKASALHRGLGFVVSDITATGFVPPGRFGFAVIAQSFWYVLHALDQVLENIDGCLKAGGLLVVSQGFVADQRYGREIADGFAGAVLALSDRLHGRYLLLEEIYDGSGQFRLADGCIVFRKVG